MRPVNRPRWAEDVLPVLRGAARDRGRRVVEARLAELSRSAQQRVRRLRRAASAGAR